MGLMPFQPTRPGQMDMVQAELGQSFEFYLGNRLRHAMNIFVNQCLQEIMLALIHRRRREPFGDFRIPIHIKRHVRPVEAIRLIMRFLYKGLIDRDDIPRWNGGYNCRMTPVSYTHLRAHET